MAVPFLATVSVGAINEVAPFVVGDAAKFNKTLTE